MSRIRANRITNQNADGAPVFPNGIVVTGVVTATTTSQNITGDLTVSGDGDIGGSLTIPDSIIHSGDTNTKIRFPAADTITAETSGKERLRISSDGYVGINTDNPVNAFEVLGKSSNTDTIAGVTVHEIARFNADTSEKLGLKLALDNTNKVFYLHRSDNGGDFAVSMRSGGQSLEKIRIASNGRVGIGTDSPASLLDIVGGKTGTNLSLTGTVQVNSNQNWNFATLKLTREASNTANTKLTSFLLDGDSASATGLYDNVNLVLRTDSAPTAGSASTTLNAGLELTAPSSIRLGTNGAERFRIASSGQIGLGGANYGTNTSTYNSQTGKSSQALVSNGGSAAPTWGYTNRPAFMARKSSTQNISTGTWTKVQLDEEVLDSDNAYDNTTNHRFTVPTGGAGWYMCHFSAGIDDIQAGDYVYARLYLNGSSINHAIAMDWGVVANQIVQSSSSHIIHLDDGEYLELFVYHNEGSTEPVEQNRCYFGAFRLNI